nr:putative ribonuclease H-like domain-containing protein [Tanacetum cinerariifolium]
MSKNTKFVKQPIVENLPKIGETNALSIPVTSNSVSTPQESKGVNNDKVIAPRMFRINSSKTVKEEKHIPNTVSASNRTKPITVSQPPVIIKKDVNFDLNGLSFTGIDNTKTRRPQPRSNTKHARVPSASKSSRSKNKEAKDVISKVVCAMCKKCLISVNHDKCLGNYVNGKNSRGKKQKAKVSFKENQMNYQPKVIIPKKVESHKILATPKPRKSRLLFRWSPTGKLFDKEGKIVDSSESKSQFDCSNGDNACTSSSLEPKIKRFPNSTSLLHRVYFVKGLGHNLFSVGQFCNSDLEVAFRRNACFVRNLKGVNLLKGDRSTNLYTINLYEMASASRICLMARASSTKSWLWHQRLSHLNFYTINDLARNDLVAEITSSLYGFVWTNENCQYKWKAVHLGDYGRLLSLHVVLKEYFDTVGISHQISSVRTPQQNGVVEQQNRTLVEAARTMLIFSRAPLFLWVEAIATACFTQNRFIIHRRFNKTPYELINGKNQISYFFMYSVLFVILRMIAKTLGSLVQKKIMETMNISFDELSAMAFEQRSSKPRLQSMTSGQISSGLDLTYAPSTIITQQPYKGKLDLLFEAMYDDYIGGQPSATGRTDVDELNLNAMVNGNTFVNPFATSSTSATASSSSQNVDPLNMHTFYQPYPYEFQWTKDHPLEQNVAGLPKFKYHKEHLCPSCEQGKSKRASHPPKPVPNSRKGLHLLHMDLCGPMRIASINGKRYVLVIVDDYSRYTWSPVIIIRKDNGTEFKNQVLKVYFDSFGISHQMSSVRTPQQNGVVERRNRTLVEAARTMLIFFSCTVILMG